MGIKKQLFPFILLFLSLLLSSCLSLPEIASTQIPTLSPTPPTVKDTPTPTIEWFPATETPIPTQNLPTSSPTPALQGTILLEDNFDQPSFWDIGSSNLANSTIENNKLTLSVNQPSKIVSMRNQPILSDFRMDLMVGAKICGQDASYGIMFRSSNPSNYYRVVIRCDKTIEIERVLNGNINHIMETIYNPLIPTNLSETAKISIIADGATIDVYVNRLKMISITDKYHSSGNIGFFAQTSGTQPMTANFSNLSIFQLK